MKERIGFYLRVSTQDQSTELQKLELERYATARGWKEVNWYEDHATGTNGNRPALKKLMADAQARRLDIVVCWKLDRLFRSMKDMVLALNDFAELGVQFVSLRDQIDMTTATGRLMTHILSAFAEFEADLIRSRVRAGLENAKKKGVKLGRPKTRNDSEILSLHRQGLSHRKIAAKLGISKGSVQKSLKKTGTKTLTLMSAYNPQIHPNDYSDLHMCISRGFGSTHFKRDSGLTFKAIATRYRVYKLKLCFPLSIFWK